jgi:hypothetical protein
MSVNRQQHTNTAMSRSKERSSLNIILGLLSIGAIVVAYTSVSKASQTTTRSRRTAPVAKGVVQSTVSGSGNLEAASELDRRTHAPPRARS